MKKVIIIISCVVIALVVVLAIFGGRIAYFLYSGQYNENGVSHFLVITIDKNQPKEFIGKLQEHDVYIEGLNIQETNFRTVNAENLSIKDAIEQNKVSIDEWKKYAWNVVEEDSREILKFENYEILVTTNECVIRPLT